MNKLLPRLSALSLPLLGGVQYSTTQCEGAESPAPQVRRKLRRRETLGMGHLKDNNQRNQELERSLGLSSLPRTEAKVYDYVIVGTGTAAQAAVELLREEDPEATILIVAEHHRRGTPDVTAENQATLSPQFQGIYDRWRRPHSSHLASMARTPNADVVVAESFDSLRVDVANHIIQVGIVGLGHKIKYGQCLLAPAGKVQDQYVLDRNVQYSLSRKVNMAYSRKDFQNMEEDLHEEDKNNKIPVEDKVLLVAGGGFLGTELCAALSNMTSESTSAKPQHVVHQVYFEEYPLSNYLPRYFAKDVSERLEAAGVVLHPLHLISDIQSTTNRNEESVVPRVKAVMLGLKNIKTQLETDKLILASTRIDSRSRIAENSALEVDPKNGGIVVNSMLEAYRDVYVAGTSASYFNIVNGRRRSSVYDHEINSGIFAARNMLVKRSNNRYDNKFGRYRHIPSYESMIGDMIHLQCVGEVHSRFETVGVWLAKRDPKTLEPLDEADLTRGIIYYLHDNKIVGIVCVNSGELLESARTILTNKNDVENLATKIRLGPEYWLRVVSTR